MPTYHGRPSRQAYLESLADEYGLPIPVVMTAASILGPAEDFDGLVSTLEEYSEVLESMIS